MFTSRSRVDELERKVERLEEANAAIVERLLHQYEILKRMAEAHSDVVATLTKMAEYVGIDTDVPPSTPVSKESITE